MEIGVREAAKLLNVSEKTIYRWVSSSRIPFFRVGHQYRFSKSSLNEWLMSRGTAESVPFQVDTEGDDPFSLEKAVRAGGIYFNVRGSNPIELMNEISNIVSLPEEVDKAALSQALLEREELCSTGIGNGIALPHPRGSTLMSLKRPVVSINFLEKAIDFSALDGKPVTILILILCPSTTLHLHILSRLSFVLQRKSFTTALKANPDREELFKKLSFFDRMFSLVSS